MDRVVEAISQSGLFDRSWYCKQYPDVGMLKVEPVQHYVVLGAALQRDPSPYFSTTSYLQDNPDVAQANLNPLYHYAVWGQHEGRRVNPSAHLPLSSGTGVFQKEGSLSSDSSAASTQVSHGDLPEWHLPRAALVQSSGSIIPFSAEDLEVKLWGGYSKYALIGLEKIKNDSSSTFAARVNAGWHLARWYFVEGDYLRALENVQLCRYYLINSFTKVMHAKRKCAIVEAQCLEKLGRRKEAKEGIERLIKYNGEHPNLNLALAMIADWATPNGEIERLKKINRLYEEKSLVRLKKRDVNAPLSFFNVDAEPAPPLALDLTGDKVTVIIPAYSAESTIHIPIGSLLNQTWQNIEIIVVDDCSPDGTAAVVEAIAKEDDRVKLIRKEVNEGAYPARNLGLKSATGKYVMVHDSDDWSHPQKIEIQLKELYANPEAVGVISHWVRFDANLKPVGAWRPTGSFFDLNFSSLLFKREVVDQIGGWDEVRVSGDAEFRSRIMKHYGENSIARVEQGYLLSLSLSREDSLTQTKATHLRSLDFGLRWHYRDAYQRWQYSENFKSSPHVYTGRRRHFPIPRSLRPGGGGSVEYRALFVTDLSFKHGVSGLLPQLMQAVQYGTVGLMHWPKYERYTHSPIDSRIYEVMASGKSVEIITQGADHQADVLIVTNPTCLTHLLDTVPDIKAKQVVLQIGYDGVAHELNRNLIDETIRNCVDVFHIEPKLVVPNFSIALALQKMGHTDVAVGLPRDFPGIAALKGRPRVPVDRSPRLGRFNREIVIGENWPRSTGFVKQVYSTKRAFDVVLGCEEYLLCSHLGKTPANWIFTNDWDLHIDGLPEMDFYVFFPEETYLGDIDSALYISMAKGIPPVLPSRYKNLFGSAAIYAERKSFVTTVQSIWTSSGEYESYSKRAIEYIKNAVTPLGAIPYNDA